MKSEQELTQFLVEKYKPLGIILHGSRVGGYAREHSDWDFFVFVDEPIPNNRRQDTVVFDGQFLDIMVWQFPVDEKYMKSYFAKYCGQANLVYVEDQRVNEMFARAQALHGEGIETNEEEVALDKEDVEKELRRISDWIDDDTGVFFLRISGLYIKLYNLWWNVKQKQFSVSTRKGLPLVKEIDKESFELLQILSSNKPNQEKFDAAVKLKTMIFE